MNFQFSKEDEAHTDTHVTITQSGRKLEGMPLKYIDKWSHQLFRYVGSLVENLMF